MCPSACSNTLSQCPSNYDCSCYGNVFEADLGLQEAECSASSSLTGGVIAGIVIAIVVPILLCVVGGCWCCKCCCFSYRQNVTNVNKTEITMGSMQPQPATGNTQIHPQFQQGYPQQQQQQLQYSPYPPQQAVPYPAGQYPAGQYPYPMYAQPGQQGYPYPYGPPQMFPQQYGYPAAQPAPTAITAADGPAE